MSIITIITTMTMTMSIIITMIMNIITTMNENLQPALPAAAAANTAPRRS